MTRRGLDMPEEDQTDGSITEIESPKMSSPSPSEKRTRSTSGETPRPRGNKGNAINRAVKARIIALLIQGYSIKDAALECGVNKHTVSDWRITDPEFQEMLAQAEDRAVEAFLEEGTKQALNQITDLSGRAAEVLKDSLNHTDPKVRLQAAGMVLRVMDRSVGGQGMGFERALSATEDDPSRGD